MIERKCENCKWFKDVRLIWRDDVIHVDYCTKKEFLAYGGDMFCSMYEDEDDQTEIKEDEE